MKSKMSLFLVAIAAAGVFALPSVMATFAGSHTMEKPGTGDEASLDCTKCHQYIATELNATTLASTTLTGHKIAANDTGYLGYMSNGEPGSFNKSVTTLDNGSGGVHSGYTYIAKGITQSDGTTHTNKVMYIIDNQTGLLYSVSNVTWTDVLYYCCSTTGSNSGYLEFYRTTPILTANSIFTQKSVSSLDVDNDGIQDNEVCKLCHMKGLFGVAGTHTSMIVVGCTNDNCHGNANVSGKAYDYFGGPTGASSYGGVHLGAGYQIARKLDAHSNFYYGMKNQSSAYVSSDANSGGQVNLSADYYVCLACHTHAGMTLNIKRPAAYDVNIDKINATLGDYKDSTGAWVKSIEINHTATNMGTNDTGAGSNVTGIGLNTSDITITKDPTSAWISGGGNQWSK